jgi:hypothetical protein
MWIMRKRFQKFRSYDRHDTNLIKIGLLLFGFYLEKQKSKSKAVIVELNGVKNIELVNR